MFETKTYTFPGKTAEAETLDEERAFKSQVKSVKEALLGNSALRIPIFKDDSQPKDVEKNKRIISDTQQSESYKKLFGVK